jgi:hypothetical protein
MLLDSTSGVREIKNVTAQELDRKKNHDENFFFIINHASVYTNLGTGQARKGHRIDPCSVF